MFEFVYGHDAEIVRFIGQFIPTSTTNLGRCKTIGVIDGDGVLVAGLIYYDYKPAAGTIELGAASSTPRWLNRTTYRRMFEYPFIECGCQMVTVHASAEKEALLTLLARMNFSLTYVPRLCGRSEDGVLCTLTDDQWLDSRVARRIYRGVNKNIEEAA